MMRAPVKKAMWQALVMGGSIALCFALSNYTTQEASATGTGTAIAPASVFVAPELKMPRNAPEARAVAALAAGNPLEARRIAQEALPTVQEPSLGRIRWLLAKSTPDIAEARPHLEALMLSSHPLAQWARLRYTERLRDRD